MNDNAYIFGRRLEGRDAHTISSEQLDKIRCNARAMRKEGRILTIFIFETGDSSCPYWDEVFVVHGTEDDVKSLEDSFAAYLESAKSDDKNYDEMAADVLAASGLTYERVQEKIPACDRMWILRI